MYEPAPHPTTTAPRRKLSSRERIAQMKARLEKLEAQEKERGRKLDTRQKIVIGGTVLAEMRSNVNFATMITNLLQQRVTRPLDQEAIAEWLQPDSTDSK